MPLVIPKDGAVQYVPSEETLGEILGHSNFDGEDWAIGDRLVFVELRPEPVARRPAEHLAAHPELPRESKDPDRSATPEQRVVALGERDVHPGGIGIVEQEHGPPPPTG